MNFSKVQEPIVSTGCDVRRLFIIPRFLHHITKNDVHYLFLIVTRESFCNTYTHTMDAIRSYKKVNSCLLAFHCILVCSTALILELRCRNANAISLVSFRSYAAEVDTFSALRLGFQQALTLIFHTVKHVFKMFLRKGLPCFQRNKHGKCTYLLILKDKLDTHVLKSTEY